MNKKLLMMTCASMLLFGAGNAAAQADTPEMTPPPPHHDMPLPPKSHHKMKPGMHTDRLAEELNLTKEQRDKAEALRKADFEKMKPLVEEMKTLREKMDNLRKENMKHFEEILTPEQKTKLDQIMQEHKNKTENFRKGHKGRRPEMDRRHAPADDIPPAPDGQPETADE